MDPRIYPRIKSIFAFVPQTLRPEGLPLGAEANKLAAHYKGLNRFGLDYSHD
jgi:hypothetical protein